MTSKTLSQLPAATTLLGDELIFGVQSGIPVAITTDQMNTAATAAAAASAATAFTHAASASSALASVLVATETSINISDNLVEINGRYYGALADDPTLRPNGTLVAIGDEYFNSTISRKKVYNGSIWIISEDAAAIAALSASFDAAASAAISASDAAIASEAAATAIFDSITSGSLMISEDWGLITEAVTATTDYGVM